VWFQFHEDGRFILKSGFDTPVDIGGGKLGHTKEEEGGWKVEPSGRIVASVKKPHRVYSITVVQDSPRGPGILVSSPWPDEPDWDKPRFLEKEEPNRAAGGN
jgi:hypothetical protein